MDSPMWKAFMENQKFTDQEASDIEIAKQQLQQDNMMNTYKQLSRSQNISDYTYIAGSVTEEDINQKTESHPHFKDYDHSLDMTRIRMEEDGAVTLADGITIPEPEPEGLRLCPRGLPEFESDEPVEEQPDFGIDWDSIGQQLGL